MANLELILFMNMISSENFVRLSRYYVVHVYWILYCCSLNFSMLAYMKLFFQTVSYD